MAFASRVFLIRLLYIFFLNLGCISFSSSADEASHIRCLRSIKDSIEDPFNRITWSFENVKASSCIFDGVGCSYDEEVILRSITLSGLGLKGQFPRGLENCTTLTDLSLSGNDLSGSIPLDLCEMLPYLHSLDLSNNRFSGKILLEQCKYLNFLDLSNNRFSSEIPLGHCDYLSSLHLSNNSFSGKIPLGLCEKQQYLASLDLSNNSFSGEIPRTIANCSYLNLLVLSNNYLTGEIPPQLRTLERLKTFSVSNNLLSGPVPTFLYFNFSQESYANNSGLCGGPLEPCKGHPWKFDYSFKSGFLVGYVISVVSVVTVFMSYCVPWIRVKSREKKMVTLTAMLILMIKRKNNRSRADN